MALRGESAAERGGYVYTEAVPSQLAELLDAGELDVSLLSSIEAFRHPDTVILSDAAIASAGPVQSVRLFGRVPPDRVRRVALDAGSRTSLVLTRILLRRWLVQPIEYVPFPLGAEMATLEADACLVIGDRGMFPAVAPWNAWCLDLAEGWNRLTGLPFVFAIWIARSGAGVAEKSSDDLTRLAAKLGQARDDGVRRLEAIAASEGPRIGICVADALDYFRRSLRFRLGNAERAGLAEFARLAVEDGEISSAAPLKIVTG